jgi:hypothetical protein
MKTPAFFLNLAILQMLQVPSGGAQIAAFFGIDYWQGLLAAVVLSFAYPVGCLVAWFGAVDQWGWNPLLAGAVFLTIFMATVLNTIVRRRFMQVQGMAAPSDHTHSLSSTPTSISTSTSGADKS